MLAIFKREISSFFASPIGYLVIGLFLLLSGLFLWVFKGPFNIFDYGFADLGNFFLLGPWVFLFLIPAITMKGFSEEKKLGTLELLLIKPISTTKVVLGKFWGAFTVCLVAIIPTLIYVFAISALGTTVANYDLGIVIGSYFGLLFLMAAYTAIGLFASSLSDNQIVAFITGIALSFFVFYGFEALATLTTDGSFQETLKSMGAKAHFERIARGIIDTRDVFYFLALTLFFLYLTQQVIKYSLNAKKLGMGILKGIIFLLAINFVGSYLYKRFDLTEDKRYTLSEPAVTASQKFESPLLVDVLLDGSIPPEFTRLRTETVLLLEQFAAENPNIKYNLVDPLADVTRREQTIQDLLQIGLTPASVTIEEEGKVSQELVFPWAMVNHNDQTVKVPLLKNKLGSTAEERINNSVQQLEYAFADAFTKLGIEERKKVVVIKGNGELDDIYIADFLSTIREYYDIGAITLDSIAGNPQQVFDQLKEFDLALVAKPTEPFTDEEKYVMDQFVVNGGKSIWLVDKVTIELDSLFNDEGSNVALQRELNLDDFFFRYGVRVNAELVNDMYNTPIVLATGDGNASQYNPLPWLYHPMIFSKDDHPINKNIEALRLQFANSIDTLPNAYQKTILLRSSPLSRAMGVPQQISLNSIDQAPDASDYEGKGNFALAVLIEGGFNSAFTNRIKPVNIKGASEKGGDNKMLVIADGDIIKNQLRNGRPLELGYDKWTSNTYGNKEFLLNCINYLLDDAGLINIRNKEVSIPLLDPQKIMAQKNKWRLIAIGLPLVLILVFGFLFNYFRKRKYAG
ncbi:gliding motility-associated ABC transporter substrate-binding protein GldG [Allomuricauda sp. SCSIO 65647]|uniref:gliding motility-associated ABC transporter substrate-binding protein GldG n=1 Tax=Allomuricauda sp. SCSIO 65647 TaxID=2908843 RepID=UPI001F27F315|nr:gliding motility-associated ABC transporter substrate-binding protein GldG [Muricauda sp. SCSIO 65647]UJH67063.1 gliding motility-associated ABC transporter substrate-binding protein GldG [Muricauda sp. SCSIO 65647]